MAPEGTKRLGDLEELPDCAPAGLKALFTEAEGIIQAQAQKLGEGTPSKAPDLRRRLRKLGIDKPDDRSVMIDKYGEHKDTMAKATEDIDGADKGIVVTTEGIGKVVTDAYDAIDTSVKELNGKVKESYDHLEDVTDKDGKPVKDENGNNKKRMPRKWVDLLFEGAWDTLDTTFKHVSGITDRVATEAARIRKDQPPVPPANNNGGGGGVPFVPHQGAGGGGGTPWSRKATAADYAPYRGSTTVDQAIEQAFEFYLKEHVPADSPLRTNKAAHDAALENWKRGYRVLIQRESGGDPNSMNNWDENAAKGTPSGGLTHTIKPTFDSNHVNGTSTNMLDPVANVAASMEYVTKTYGVSADGSNLQQQVQQADPTRSPKGY
ncbi:hypothetical protein [Nocardia mexicana]|uniref:Transglycosylase-like protein with SLT domain n=1 Tax=Nocardia mexicana TaxID=279262 RepID=A0A370HC31_9NOCA|nr:hypothetical protein [Nocardia mexicana]RDI54503.1 hypothetical protein DFR68_102631 [Nocardia mexicana]